MTATLFAPLRSLEDVRAVEARPYEAFMPWTGLHQALAAVAARQPDAPAITLMSDDTQERAVRWTYQDLLSLVERAGNLFRTLAAGAEPRVAMLLPAMPEAYAALWGAASVGTICPINYLLRTEHIHELLRAARCNIVVALGSHPQLSIHEKLTGIRAACPEVRELLWVGDRPAGQDGGLFQEAMDGSSTGLAAARCGDDTAALFHTGGTTGSPKLARHTHRNQLHSAAGAASLYGLRPQDCIVNAMPLFHVAGTIVFGLSTILAGGHIVLPTVLGLRNPLLLPRYWELVAMLQATLLTATPTGIASLLAAPRQAAHTASVRALLTGGAPLPPELALEFEATTGIAVRNTFGMTESAGVVSIEPVCVPRDKVSCGIRIPFTEVEVVGPDQQPTPDGAVGVLRLRGPNVSPGYTDAPRDAGTFDAGWLLSGDLARIRDGRIEVTGRAKDVIIRNAHNIDPQQIEEALMRHPGVQLAAAVGQPDEYAGELPVAFVVARPGFRLSESELLAFASAHIPERPAQPKRIDVVEALPQTAVGKVYKPALRLLTLERGLAERLEATRLAADFSVRCRDEAHGLCVDFVPRHTGAVRPELHERLRALMRSFPYEWRIAAQP
jgi:fatty-acyl-CoA synthase